MFDAPKQLLVMISEEMPDGVAQAPINEVDFVTTTEYSLGKKFACSFGVGLNINSIIMGYICRSYIQIHFDGSVDHSKILSKDVNYFL
jgi:hypothetical protein